MANLRTNNGDHQLATKPSLRIYFSKFKQYESILLQAVLSVLRMAPGNIHIDTILHTDIDRPGDDDHDRRRTCIVERRTINPLMKLNCLVIDVIYYLGEHAPILDDATSNFPVLQCEVFKQNKIMVLATNFQPVPGHHLYMFDEGDYQIFPGPRYMMMENMPTESNGYKYKSPVIRMQFDYSVSFGLY